MFVQILRDASSILNNGNIFFTFLVSLIEYFWMILSDATEKEENLSQRQ